MNSARRSLVGLSAIIAMQGFALMAETVRRKGERVKGLTPAPQIRPGQPRLKRNAPCPCGSGRKFKDCHLVPRDRLEPVKATAEELAGV